MTVPENVPTYTFMSSEGVKALQSAIADHISSGRKLNMELNGRDADLLVKALQYVYVHVCSYDDLSEWAGEFLSDLASTFGIEWI